MSESLDLWRGVPWLLVSWMSSASCGAVEIKDIFLPPPFFFFLFKKVKIYADTSRVRKQKPLKKFCKSRNTKNVLSETFHSDKNQNISLRLQPL